MASVPTFRRCDPFDYDLYVGFSATDAERVRCLLQKLSADSFNYWSRYDLNALPLPPRRTTEASADDDVSRRIVSGIEYSEKCVLYVTSSYVDSDIDGHYADVEIDAVLEKHQLFDDAVFLLTDGVADGSVVPKKLLELNLPTFHCYLQDSIDHQHTTPVSQQWNDFIAKLCVRPTLRCLPQSPRSISGAVAAFAYFNSYLRNLLPNFRERIAEHVTKHLASASESAAAAAALPVTEQSTTDEEISTTSRVRYIPQMLIVVPDSCRPPPTMEIPNQIDHVGFVSCSLNHRGDKHRDFKVTLLKLVGRETVNSRDKCYYFAGEFPAVLLTMYQTYVDGLAGLTEQQLCDERNNFCRCLEQLLHGDESGHQCRDQYKLISWNDGKSTLYDQLLTVADSCSTAPVTTSQTDVGTAGGHIACTESGQLQRSIDAAATFNKSPVEVHEQSLLCSYPMTHRPRGICSIVIGMPKVPTDNDAEAPTMAIDDSAVYKLARLFGDTFQFEVQLTYETTGVSRSELFACVESLGQKDHSSFDAFVLCLLSDSKRRGFFRTADGSDVGVVDLAEKFYSKRCRSLQNKPKIVLALNMLTLSELSQQLVGSNYRNFSATTADAELPDETAVKTLYDQPHISHDAVPAVPPISSALGAEEPFFLRCADFSTSHISVPNECFSILVDIMVELLNCSKQFDRAMSDVMSRFVDQCRIQKGIDIPNWHLPINILTTEKSIVFQNLGL